MTRNLALAPAAWPFEPTVKADLVLSNVMSCKRDRFCRCRKCKPSLVGVK